jgi:uncharacterized RDD family membrane protein YckC
MAKLLVQESNGAREFELVDLEVNIGRELDNTLRLSDPSISRHHAVIRMGPAGYEIHDLQSSNGVLLNGNKVPSGPLRDGDRITLGQMQLTFVDPQPGPGGNPLGTVRMDSEAMARLWGGAQEAPLPAPEAPAPAPAEPQAPPPLKPGPAFLHPWLPGSPDQAIPLRAADGGPERAGFTTRLQAGLIDASPMLALSFVGLVITFGIMPGLGCLFAMLQLVLLVAYLILLPLYWMRLGATPGKAIMKLRVVQEADPGATLDLNGSIMRLLGYLVNAAISWVIMGILIKAMPGPLVPRIPVLKLVGLVVWVIPYLLILGAARKALEDRFSRSIVIKVDR